MRTLLPVLVSLFLVGCNTDSSADSPGVEASETPSVTYEFEDPEVDRIYSEMMASMAPGGAWDRTRYLRFDWVFDRGDGNPFVRSHSWDRYTGDYKLEMTNREGGEVVAVFNTEAPEDGRVWLDGVEQEGETADEMLDGAHGAYINDAYWFIMPYKWADPGVNTRFVGIETDEEGREWEVVELSFEGVGRTPDNMYRAFVNPDSNLMERWWHYRAADAEPSPADWTEWTEIGGVMLALNRPRVDGSRIHFQNVIAAEEIPEGAFSTPE